MVGGGRLLAITWWMVPRQLTFVTTSSPGQTNRAAGCGQAESRRRSSASLPPPPPPPPPGRTRGALRRTCASRNDLGSEANPRRCRAGGEPPARRAHLATPHRRLAPQPGHRRPLSVRPRAPTWGRPPATSPLTAASSSAAIAGATRPAPQPQVWQHRKVRARPALAQAATPERARAHAGPRQVPWLPPPQPPDTQPASTRRPPAAAAEHADWGSPASQSGRRGAGAGERGPARGGVTVRPAPPTPRREAKCGKAGEVAP